MTSSTIARPPEPSADHRAGLSSSRASRTEMLLATAVFLLAGAVIYGPHVVDGGFAIDDWSHAAGVANSQGDLLAHYWAFTSNRPVLVGYVPLTHLVFGTHEWAHLAWSVVLAVALSTALYAVLRRFSLRPLQAGAISLLVLLFPWSDSVRFWATASHISMSIALGLAGILLALRGLDARAAGNRRAGLALHGAALALYATSVLTYEIAGVVLLLAGSLYLTRGSWEIVRGRWAADIAVILPCLAWNVMRADRERPSLAEMLDHAEVIADSGATILGLAAFPFGTVDRSIALASLAAIFSVAIAVRMLRSKDDGLRSALDRWLLVAGGGLLIVVAGWVLYVPADPYYAPIQPGVGNRVNAMAAIGIVVVVLAAVVLLSTLVARSLPGRKHLAAILGAALAALLVVGYADRTRDDQRAWARASTAAHDVLAATRAALPSPPPGSTIYTFGHAGSERPGILIFGFTWDLHGAVRLSYGDSRLAAYPIVQGTTIGCLADRVTPVGPGWIPERHGARYGTAYFVDVPTATAQRIDSRQACQAVLPGFRPGPVTRAP